MLESTIEKKVTKYAESLGWLAYKFSSPNNRGVPDRLYIRNGVVIFIEFKQLGKKPTKLQTHHINKIKAQSIAVYVVDSVDAGEAVFNAH